MKWSQQGHQTTPSDQGGQHDTDRGQPGASLRPQSFATGPFQIARSWSHQGNGEETPRQYGFPIHTNNDGMTKGDRKGHGGSVAPGVQQGDGREYATGR